MSASGVEPLLADLARTVIEAALEAELSDHLTNGTSGNSRNGCRPKVVRTVLGPVRIEVPRDRWGTFDPVTVGKWRREVVGLDRLLLPLAAKHAPPETTLRLLAHAYPPDVPERTLRRIASTARERLAEWHDRALEASYAGLELGWSALRDRNGRVAGAPFVWVVGTTPPDRGGAGRELLSLHSVTRGRLVEGTDRGTVDGTAEVTDGVNHEDSGGPWSGVFRDLQRRGVRWVKSVAGDNFPEFREHVGRLWPDAVVTGSDGRPGGLLVG